MQPAPRNSYQISGIPQEGRLEDAWLPAANLLGTTSFFCVRLSHLSLYVCLSSPILHCIFIRKFIVV